MNTTETITWHPASEPPNSDRTVQTFASGSRYVSMGYFDEERESSKWCAMDGFPITAPDYWAELPRGPK